MLFYVIGKFDILIDILHIVGVGLDRPICSVIGKFNILIDILHIVGADASDRPCGDSHFCSCIERLARFFKRQG